MNENIADKLIIVGVMLVFGWSAIHGAAFSQHVVDWALGALGVLIVQKTREHFRTPPDAPAS
jgi:hypothetical protein